MIRFLLPLAGALLIAACGSSQPASAPATSALTTASPPATERATTTKPETTTGEDAAEPLPGLPRYTARYDTWTKLNRKRIPPRDSGDAHLGTKNVFASRKRRANGRFPDSTIIVKDALRPGKDFVGLVAVMRKRKGADPAHNDWIFVEWTRARARDAFTETASGAVCWSCHVGAAGNDYVWLYELGLGE